MASASTEVITGPEEIRFQISKFLKGTSPDSRVHWETVSSSALFLLRTVPVARHAVLEHYSQMFDDAIGTFLNVSDRLPQGNQDLSQHQKQHLAALHDVTGVLLSFVKSNPEAWAPVVSSWTLTLLGQLSCKYAAKRGTQHATSLNEVLQMWLTCQPARLLLEISTECFAAMVGAAPDICVDSLLEASVRFSPHFDWVVAHIGSCYPRTIITRVLNCGLKDYCNDSGDKDNPGTSSGTSTRHKVPKMASVVGILGHLAAKHGQDIRKALMALFEASLHSDSQSSKVTTLPFLLQLASMSDMLLQLLTSDIISVLTPKVLNELHHQFNHWKRASPGDYNSFLNLVVHLIVKSRVGACKIIDFVLNTAAPADGDGDVKPEEEVRDTCVEIIHILLFELQRGVLSRKGGDHGAVDIPLLVGLASQTDALTKMLLHKDQRRFPWIQKLLTYTALHAGQSCAASILSSVICNAKTPQQLATFFSLRRDIELGIPSVMGPTLQQVFNRLDPATSTLTSLTSSSSESEGPSQAKITKQDGATITKGKSSSEGSLWSQTLPQLVVTLKNLDRILDIERRREKKNSLTSGCLIQDLQSRHSQLLPFLLHPDPSVQRCTLSLINKIGFPQRLGSALLTRMAGAVTQAFFTSLHLDARREGIHTRKRRMLQAQGETNKTDSEQSEPCHEDPSKYPRGMTGLCMSCIEQLSNLPYIRSLLLHYLVEGATHKEHCHLFSGKWTASLFGSSSASPPTTSEPPSSSSTSTTSPSSSSSSPSSVALATTAAADSGFLLQENRQQGNSIAVPRFHSSVYHGGVIKLSSKLSNTHKPLPKEKTLKNVLTLVETVWLCCREVTHSSCMSQQPLWGAPASANGAVKPQPMDTDLRKKKPQAQVMESSARTLGCVMVDILTLDSLYNDVNWQDPDFRKVTTERDILVWKRLEAMPFLWNLLQEFSSSCVFLYYVSPVLRSLVAVVMNHLEVSREPRMRNCPQQTEAAVKLVYCLGQGSWIPSPLSNVSELFPYVTPHEGYLLLLTIWRYIKERPPSEFESSIADRTCDNSHMSVVNSIIHANIDNIGHLCTRIFNM